MKLKGHLKLGIFILAAATGLSGCGKKDDKDKEATEDTSVTEVSSENTAEPIDLTMSYKRGRVNGQNYNNEFFGFSCELDENWKLYNDAEIDEINQFQAGAATDENVALVLEQSYLLDMAAARYDGKGNMSIIVQTVEPGGYSEQDYAESGVASAAYSLEQGGYTDVRADIGTVKFCGRERVSINISAVSPPDASAGDAEKSEQADTEESTSDKAEDGDSDKTEESNPVEDSASDKSEDSASDKTADNDSSADSKSEGHKIYEKQITAINGKYICVLTFKADSEKEVDEMIALFK